MNFPDLGDLVRVAGGRNQLRPESEDPEAGELREARFNSPADLAVSGDGNEIFLVERSGVLSRIDLGTRRIAPLLTKDVLHFPQTLALDEPPGGKRFVYVADTRNCRVVRVDADANTANDPASAKVVFGVERRLNLKQALPGYPVSNGCNGGKAPFESDECRAEFADSPAGVAVWRSSQNRAFLFVSLPLQNRIVTVDPETGGIVGTLGPFPQECPSPNLLAAPRFLRRIGDDLYIASDGVKIGVEARGIVIRSHITEGGDGIPRLGLPAHIAGNVSPDPDLRCGCSESSLSNYSPEQECAPADEVPLGNPSAVFLDAAGDVYFCDVNNQRIRKLVACNGEASKTQLVTFLGDSAEGREEAESFLGIDELAPAGGECSAAPLLRGLRG